MEPSTDSKTVLECDWCEDEFERYKYRVTDGDNFCSPECRVDHQQSDNVYVDCSNCGDSVKVPPSRQSGEYGDYHLENHFCDKECESEWKGEHWGGEDHHNYQGGKVDSVCEECGETYAVKAAKEETTRFCSRECYAASQRLDASSGPGPTTIEVECDWCGSEIERQPKDVEKTENTLCSKECFSEWISERRRGSNNPAWKGGKGGIDAVRRMLGEQSWDKTAREVRRGSGHVCQKCGCFQPKKELSVHHIIPVASGGTNEPWNLMPLCEVCHGEVEKHTRQFTEPHLLKYV